MSDVDLMRRFSGVRRLYGDAGFERLQHAHVVVVGIGGVGSWAVEALARNALGRLTLVDLDNVAESNVNRQIHALEENFGKAKVTAMAERIQHIHPFCQVQCIEEFITPDNIHSLLQSLTPHSAQSTPTVVLDCTDDMAAKLALVTFCRAQVIPLIVSGAAGGRLDPTRIKTADLALVQGDKLLAKLRNQLRKSHGFPKGSEHKKPSKMHVLCVYSDEQVIKPSTVCATPAEEDASSITGLHCAGYGSAVSVTATFGLVAAQLGLNLIVKS